MILENNTLSRRDFIGRAVAAGIVVAGTGASVLSAPSQALAVTAAEKKAEADAALAKLNALEEQLDQATINYDAARAEQQAAQQRMEDAQTRIDDATIHIADLQDQLSVRARSMYRSGSSSFIDMLLGATSFQAFTTNWDILNNMNEADARMVQETKDLRSEVEEQKIVYEEEEAIAQKQAEEAEAVQAQAQALVDEVQATYSSLSAEAEQLLAQEQEAARIERQRQAEAELARQRAQEEAAGKKNKSNQSVASANNSKKQTVTGNTVVDRAYSQIGVPYLFATEGAATFDCSGFVGYCLTGNMGSRWCSTNEIEGWTKVSDPQPGDICIRPGHTGVYIGGGQMIHASVTRGVVVDSVQSGMWYVRY